MTSTAHSRNYGKIFLALFFLTIIEIFLANLPVHKGIIILALLFFAFVKAALVAAFYMHLRFEKLLLTILAFAPLIFTAIFILIIGWDLTHARYLH